MSKGSSTLFFYYDDSGNPTSFSDGTNMYYYVKNIHGDIVKIFSSTGAVVANYAYNVWGELLYIKDAFGNSITDTSSIAFLNPLRYRGYVYDAETGLYYLMSRYYDPIIHRFINADGCFQSGECILDSNMTTYCRNNPIVYNDNNGNRPTSSTSVKNESPEERKVSCKHQQKVVLERKRIKKIPTNPTTFASVEFRAESSLEIESNMYPIDFYEKTGHYYVDNYTPSYVTAYASSSIEAGVDIGFLTLSYGIGNIGAQFSSMDYTNPYSIETSFSLKDFCFIVGWDKTTYQGNGYFVESGSGIEINGLTIVLAAVTIAGYLYGMPAPVVAA